MTRPYRVLIADDEKTGRGRFAKSTGIAGLRCRGRGQRRSAGHRDVPPRTPRCRFMDIEMPGMDGLAAARQIAEDPGTPVIILTAHGHPNLIDQAVEDGVISYLLEPATNPALNAAIEVAVARARELQVLQENIDQLK